MPTQPITQPPTVSLEPVQVHLPMHGGTQSSRPALRLAVIIVTWNRKELVTSVLRALTRQTIGASSIDAVIVDNCSTDGTLDHLVSHFCPERVVENPTDQAHHPNFQAPDRPPQGPNTLGFSSLTIVRNTANLGGCGGFNTGFAYVEHTLDGAFPPEYLWLVDDDIDLPADAAANLARVAQADPSIGLVGSRTVDLNNRDTTIETTIYFDPKTGRMGDAPPANHPQSIAHCAWLRAVGSPRGQQPFSGVRDVDVVSACSLLARWSAVKKIGFWDYRYFIYCDDADWCLRFAKAGYRVVLSLDAVVFHTPWNHKLTPARAYYAQRNVLWLIQKILPARRLKPAMLRWSASILKQSLYAALHRRLFHAEIIRRSVHDMQTGRWGKLDSDGPPSKPLAESLHAAGLLRPGATIAIVCNRPDSLKWAAELRRTIADYLGSRGSQGGPSYVEIVRNDTPGAESKPDPAVRRVVYSSRRRSRFRRQLTFLARAPDAVVVYEQDNDFPLVASGLNIHIDRRQPDKCQIEPDGPVHRLVFLARWFLTAARTLWFAARLRPYVSPTKYG